MSCSVPAFFIQEEIATVRGQLRELELQSKRDRSVTEKVRIWISRLSPTLFQGPFFRLRKKIQPWSKKMHSWPPKWPRLMPSWSRYAYSMTPGSSTCTVSNLLQYESQVRYEHVLSENAHLRESERQLRHQLSKIQELYKLEENRTKKLTSQVAKGVCTTFWSPGSPFLCPVFPLVSPTYLTNANFCSSPSKKLAKTRWKTLKISFNFNSRL